MRTAIAIQPKLGTPSIHDLQLDLKSRDDIPRVLRTLQYIYCDKSLFTQVTDLLNDLLPQETQRSTGRPGMHYWRVLVLGMLRHAANCDYDRLQELANKHADVRTLLRHGAFDDRYYALQTIKDNVRLFTPEMLDQINQHVVLSGHNVLQAENPRAHSGYLRGRCDSFVVETHVCFPTDIKLLFQACCRLIDYGRKITDACGANLWRQSRHLKKKHRESYQKLRNKRHRFDKAETVDSKRANDADQVCIGWLEQIMELLDKSTQTAKYLAYQSLATDEVLARWTELTQNVHHQANLVMRRLLLQENIPHAEKIFSWHAPHTEWISKGKAGVPQELGLRVCVLQDQYGFTLHHHVMEQQTDSEVAVLMVKEAQARFPNLKLTSFDKGFWSPENFSRLNETLNEVIMPKKGKCNAEEKAREDHIMFKRAKRKHSAVESDINSLEARGLDKCRDHGIEGFKRYVAMSVLADNMCRLGAILLEQDARKAEAEAKKQEGLKRSAKRKPKKPTH